MVNNIPQQPVVPQRPMNFDTPEIVMDTNKDNAYMPSFRNVGTIKIDEPVVENKKPARMNSMQEYIEKSFFFCFKNMVITKIVNRYN